MVITCVCCGKPVVVAYQERMTKPPLLLITCRERGCRLRFATMAVERPFDYPQHARNFLDKESQYQLTIWGAK